MSDALFKGAARLAVVISTRCLDHPEGHGDPNINTAISIDPGVKALVSFVKIAAALDEDSFIRNEAVAALKLWEHGS